MTDLQCLVAGVLGSPADNTPRLVLADYLEESGKPWSVARAELIRLQCATPSPQSSSRADQLLRKYALRWLPRPGRQAGGTSCPGSPAVAAGVVSVGLLTDERYTFARGFVSALAVEWGAFPVPATAPRLVGRAFEGHPLERVTFRLTWHEPEVRFVVAPNADAGIWQVSAYAYPSGEGLDEDSHLATESRPDRRAIAWHLPNFVARQLAAVDFERVTDDDGLDDDAGEPDFERDYPGLRHPDEF